MVTTKTAILTPELHVGWCCPMICKGTLLLPLSLHTPFPPSSPTSSSLSSFFSSPWPPQSHWTSPRSQGLTVDTIILPHCGLNKIINVLAMEGGTGEHQLLQVAKREHRTPRREVIWLVQGHSGPRIHVSDTWLSVLFFFSPQQNFLGKQRTIYHMEYYFTREARHLIACCVPTLC